MTIDEACALCLSRYGESLLDVDSTTALWVAEYFGGWENWRKIAAYRNRMGRGTASPAFGSVCALTGKAFRL